ncbi:MAG: protein kinase domain-containing protein [Planctomycetota bacterium]|jgi:serine/threonine-protein kinase
MDSESPQKSILARLEGRGSNAPRVHLREPDGESRDPGEVLRRAGHYEILGEIASGGVGAVLRARDMDLGRDVALKVLHDKHLKNPELVQRLIEEAQIGGQLQHPAIVPVYDIGLDDRNVPFLAMKLVKGETLAALLQARTDVDSQQRRFLSHFHHACQAMAYAHSRGVVHRDLKPSNLMVGSYGEVMILDWGFCKVLARGGIADERRATLYREDITRIETVRSADSRAQSVEGSIMGTPAYMPPEQALGHIDDLDKRSDVFSLGAILCEILTGTPPYGRDPGEVMLRSAQGDVQEAFKRLDATGADAGLVEACKACLSPLRKDRPKDAGVLADAVGGHLAAMEGRARRMEVAALRERKRAAKAKADAAALHAAAAAARTEAAEERESAKRAREEARRERDAAAQARRARKQALAIAATLLAVVLIGGGGYIVNRNMDQTRRREARLIAEAGLDKVQQFRSEGKLREAMVAARQVTELGREGGVDTATIARAEELLSAMNESQRTRQDAEAKQKREREFLAALEPCRARRSTIFDPSRTDAMYAAAFRKHGIDLKKSERQAARIVQACLDPAPVLAALDDWAWLRRVRLRQTQEDWGAPLRIAEMADGDSWRKELRQAVLSLQSRRVLALAEEGPANLPAEGARLLGISLWLLGHADEAVDFLGKAQLQHGNDPWLLGLVAYGVASDPLAGEAAIRYSTALVTLRPKMAELRVESAYVASRSGAVDRALQDCGHALTLDSGLPEAHALHAHLLEMSGDQDAALKAWQRAVQLNPKSAATLARYGMALLHSGDEDGALRECRKAGSLGPDDAGVQLALAKAALAANSLSAARAACKAVLRERKGDAEAHRTLGLVFLRAKHMDEARKELEEAARFAPEDPFVRNTLGLLYLRQKNLAGAHAAFTKAAGNQGPPRAAALANLAQLWLARDNVKAAINACRQCVDTEGADRESPWSNGFTSSGKSPLDQILDVLREVTHRNPNFAYAHHRLAVALEKRGLYVDAIRACGEAIRLDPEYAHCMETLAWIYTNCPQANLRNPAKAVEIAQRLGTIKSYPAADASQILGIAKYRMRDYRGATAELGRSVQLRGGGDAWDWYFLAMANWQTGNQKFARRWLAKASAWSQENDPKDPRLHQFREEAEAMVK